MSEDLEFSEIPRVECLELLSERSLGRLGVIDDGRPHWYHSTLSDTWVAVETPSALASGRWS